MCVCACGRLCGWYVRVFSDRNRRRTHVIKSTSSNFLGKQNGRRTPAPTFLFFLFFFLFCSLITHFACFRWSTHRCIVPSVRAVWGLVVGCGACTTVMTCLRAHAWGMSKCWLLNSIILSTSFVPEMSCAIHSNCVLNNVHDECTTVISRVLAWMLNRFLFYRKRKHSATCDVRHNEIFIDRNFETMIDSFQWNESLS